MKSGAFTIRRISAKERGYRYTTFQLTGHLAGERVRKRFKSSDEAEGEKNRLEVAVANRDGGIWALNTRLTNAQLAEAESAFARLGSRSLSGVVEWYLMAYVESYTGGTRTLPAGCRRCACARSGPPKRRCRWRH